ncbi:helix-turn-helix transcriptional regulator, partial [Bacteroides ovatus]
METKDINKQEYQLRINKVTDYIHNHIDQPLSLQKMAGIACFSPFHFHRVFTILTGETPTDYI